MKAKRCGFWLVPMSLAIAWIALTALGAIGEASAAEPSSWAKYPPALREVLTKAQQEGEVLWDDGSSRRTVEQENLVMKAFEATMGFPLKVRFYFHGQAVPQTVSRYITEAKSGVNPGADIFTPSGADHLSRLKEGKASMPVDWAAFGVAPADYEARIYGIYLWDNIRGIIYNKQQVPEKEVPRRYADLLDPKWKGKIVGTSNLSHFPFWAVALGEQQAFDLVRKLMADQKIVLTPTVTDPPGRVASGEFAIGLAHNTRPLRDMGAPLAWALMQEKSGSIPSYGVVLNNCKHPNAAQALLYFLGNTPAGQKAFFGATYGGKRTTPGTDAFEVLGEGRGLPMATFDWITKKKPQLEKEFAKILGIR